jgi:hypothetical protein
MSTMQTFYDHLFSKDEEKDYFQTLVKLTRVSLSQIENIKSSITWTIWNTTNN